MIITEFYSTREDGVNLVRTYSDEGRYIVQSGTNAVYEEAVDVENAGYTYTEGDLIPVEETTEIDPYAQAGRIMMGVMP